MLSAYDLMLIDSDPDGCAGQELQKAWKMAVRSISDLTATYLTPAELDAIWNKITSSACYRNAAPDQKTWPDLLFAISRRDAPDVVKFGTSLLVGQTSNSGPDLTYLTTVVAAAYIQMGQNAAAHRLLEEQWSKCDHSGPYRISLLSLLALSRPTN
jgi:hypothetical protein